LWPGGTRVAAGYDHEILDAPIDSGLANSRGSSATYDYGWASASQIVKRVTFEGRIGAASIDGFTLTPYGFNARVRATDSVLVSGGYSYNFFIVSPRTLELGLTERRGRLGVEWDPASRYHVSVDGNYQDLSDGNARSELAAMVRRAMARTERMNLDLGVSAYTLSAARDLPDGYYDPERYENYALVFFPYFKISENVGLGFSLAAGVQRARQADSSFRFGGNAVAEATIGIYRPWALKVSGTVTNNQRAESGAFSGFGGSAALIRRF